MFCEWDAWSEETVTIKTRYAAEQPPLAFERYRSAIRACLDLDGSGGTVINRLLERGFFGTWQRCSP